MLRFCSEHFAQTLGNQATNISSVSQYIPDYGRADIGLARRGQQKHRFNFGEVAVGMCNGLFKLKICRISQPPQYVLGTDFPAEIHSQPLIGNHLKPGLFFETLLNEPNPGFRGKHILLFRIDANGKDEFVEEGESSFNDVIVPQRKGIEGSRKQSSSHTLNITH